MTRQGTDVWARILAVGWEVQDDGCWKWGGYIDASGYGIICVSYVRHRVHRVSLEHSLGLPLEPGKQANHTCDYRACMNPEHLYAGTQRQNMQDMSARGRHATNLVYQLQQLTDEELTATIEAELSRRNMKQIRSN